MAQMPITISKSRFKADAEAIFRLVERSGQSVIITDHGKPVLTVAPYRDDSAAALRALRGTVTRYDAPAKPVTSGWESAK